MGIQVLFDLALELTKHPSSLAPSKIIQEELSDNLGKSKR